MNLIEFLKESMSFEWEMKTINIGNDQLAYQSGYSTLFMIKKILETKVTSKTIKTIINKRFNPTEIVETINEIISSD